MNDSTKAVALTLDKQADKLVQDLAVAGDNHGATASELLDFITPFAGDLFSKTPASKRTPTWYKQVIDLGVGNMSKNKTILKRLNNAWYKAFELNAKRKDPEYPQVLSATDNGFTKCVTGATPDLVLDTKTVMGYTVSDITAWTSAGAKDPKSATYDKLGTYRKEVVMPVREEVTMYRRGKKRDMIGSLTRALKTKLGVASNVKTDTDTVDMRIPVSIAAIVKYRNKSKENDFPWTAEQDKLFDEGVALIEKSCK